MPITQRSEAARPRHLVPAGNHIARCFSMVDIGTVEDEYKGETKWLQKVRIGWELPLEKRVFDEAKGEQPHAIYKEYTMSMGKKANLRKMVDSWRGVAFTDEQALKFDITKLMGQPCMVNVIHRTSEKGNVYEEVTSVTPIPKGMTAPAQINPTFVFTFDNWTEEAFNKMPEFLREKIKRSLEYKEKFESQPMNHDREILNGINHELTEDSYTSQDLPF